MPPVQLVGDFPGISVESLLDQPTNTPTPNVKRDSADPTENVKTLTVRSDSSHTYAPGKGSIDPHSIQMKGLLALFALLGAALVLAAIWFFFWAKNGGFVWRKGDWEDYKSTVLRRKGPDGRTLSNATKSTKLGGGSIVGRGYSDDGYTYDTGYGYTDTATTVTEKEPKRKRNFKEAAKQKFRRLRRDEPWEGEADADDDVLAYRQEKPARVGGINREAEGTYHGSDYDTSNPGTHYTASEMSEVRDYAYEPRRKERRDFSFTPGTEDMVSRVDEHSHLRQPSTRRHNRRRERRRNPPPTSSRQGSPRKRDRRSAPGTYTEPLDFSSAGTRSDYQYSNVDTEDDKGTKSYHHPIPGLSKGYRRDGGRGRRRDSLSESDGETGYL
ncbi:hypothetical protein PHISCL_09786 [Aspergillus sclerotialis]|uniref:Endosomal SPRY domain protein n=1 Tax=Aspergillus sclerotialis TaxID=2070753 RepID=A0A3A2ZJ27_9EURO|nr:hypothetical protein PHISCL_09786 [Aspergillus sclerotialis]